MKKLNRPSTELLNLYKFPSIWLAGIGSGFCLVLMALRLSNAMSFSEPLQLMTSGAEYESLFAIWKIINGQVAYTDRLQIPYNAVVYNWAFYHGYAAITGFILNLFSLGDAWLPTIGRLITLLGVAVGAVFSYMTFISLFYRQTQWSRPICLCFAIFLMSGPLIGWWGLTVRSDVWALTFEIMGAYFFLKYYSQKIFLAVLLLAVLCYLAWSFKQINVFAVTAGGLLLLIRQKWRAAALLTALMITAWATTLIGGDDYISAVFMSDFTLNYSPPIAILIFMNYLVKSAPSLAIFAGLFWMVFRSPRYRKKLWSDTTHVFALFGLTICLVIAVSASLQSGAAENYYFSFSYFLVLLAVAGLALITESNSRLPHSFSLLLSAGFLALSVAVTLVLNGSFGEKDLRPLHKLTIVRMDCLKRLPKPLFTDLSYLALPWMIGGEGPYFPISFNYYAERKAGKVFESGGVAGLIQKGYFKSLALAFIATKKSNQTDFFDNASLAAYRKKPAKCGNLNIFTKIEKGSGR